MYLCTLAPGVTFWDAGEFIAAAHGFGIPHPPGTPLYVALGRSWIAAAGWLVGSARAMNLLSALATAGAGAVTAWMIARETRADPVNIWRGALCGAVAGVMCSAWSNATETEVYAVALLHVMVLVASAMRAGDEPRDDRWLLVTAYLIALAPALHLSALLGAPAAIVAASRSPDGRWRTGRVLVLGAVLMLAAGVGRMSPVVIGAGMIGLAASAIRGGRPAVRRAAAVALLAGAATSALVIMLLRARHEPAINQGDPATWAALADVVARRQYPVAGLWPRQAPAWLQAANVAQYADWQFAMAWGRGVFTTPARVLVTVLYVALGWAGWRALRREAPRLALVLAVLLVCGSAGAAGYLNLRAGASLGWGILADSAPHEARERDYFFVLGFWAWGCMAGWGACTLARRMGRPRLAVAALILPLAGNWAAVDRSREPAARAARTFAVALLADAPPDAVLFTGGDNDSYPLWYLQQVEGYRPDVAVVTIPLLPAAWYGAEVARRTGLRVSAVPAVEGAQWRHERLAAAIARAAGRAGRPVAASPAVTLRERTLLGSGWTLGTALFVAGGEAAGAAEPASVAPAAARRVAGTGELPGRRQSGLPDDVSGQMLRLLECPRLGAPWRGTRGSRDSLEVTCNFR